MRVCAREKLKLGRRRDFAAQMWSRDLSHSPIWSYRKADGHVTWNCAGGKKDGDFGVVVDLCDSVMDGWVLTR